MTTNPRPNPDMRRSVKATTTYYIAVAALLVGAAIGAVVVTLSTSPQLDDARSDNQRLRAQVNEAEERAEAAEADRRTAQTLIDEQSEELDQRATGLDEREAKIATAEQQQAANQMTGGMHTVGMTVLAGTYTTNVTSGMCYYAWKSGTGADAEIVDNNIVESGPATVTLEDGQIFETTGCGTWTKQ